MRWRMGSEMIPRAVKTWLAENQSGEIVSTRPVGGGCINNGMIITTDTSDTFFLKTNTSLPPDMFAREIEGLAAIRVSEGPAVPQAYLHGPDFLLLEDLAPAARRGDYWETFGRQLAALHNITNQQFGFSHQNYIGSTAQPNNWTDDGYHFFAEYRLLYMARLACERGLLEQSDLQKAVKIAVRLPELVPIQPPALLHGDLWSGNAMTDATGGPAIIDPAAHYGWAEAELAMTTLFGLFPGTFYRAYETIRPLEPDYQARFPIYNLYHLLNHVVIFGRSYLGQVKSILRRYS
jgi:protein-ribulosamine 3-kinase